jgi:hypothetical protein
MQTPPARNEFDTKPQGVTKLLCSRHGAIRALTVDKQNLGEGEDDSGAFLPSHPRFSRRVMDDRPMSFSLAQRHV